MTKIQLNPEQNNLFPITIIVRNKDISYLKKLQYQGGFKRYGLDIVEEIKQKKYTDYQILSHWLSKVF